MSVRTVRTIARGISLLANGKYRVRATVGKTGSGGITHERIFDGDSRLRLMKSWQRSEYLRIRSEHPVVQTKGTLSADLLPYLRIIQNRLEFPKKRAVEIKAWMPRFAARKRHTITKNEVREQVRDWQADGVSASAIRHRLTALSQLYALLDGEDAYNPTKGVKRPSEPKPRPGGKPVETIRAVLDAMTWRVLNWNRGWATLARARLMAHSGLRQSQLRRLTRDDFVLDAAVPHIVVANAGKDGEPHAKPLGQDALDAARLFLRVGCFGDFSSSSLYKSWARACKDAEVPVFAPYRLRHSWATTLRSEGMDVSDIQALLGHTSPKTTQRYAAVAPDRLTAAARMLDRAWQNNKPAGARVGAEGGGTGN